MPKIFKGVLIAAVTLASIVAFATNFAEGFGTIQTYESTDVAVFASTRDAGVSTNATPDAALFRAHRDFSHSVSDCAAPGDEDFKSRPEKTLARIASN